MQEPSLVDVLVLMVLLEVVSDASLGLTSSYGEEIIAAALVVLYPRTYPG